MLIYIIVRDDTIRQLWVKAIGLDGKIGIFNFQGAGTNGNDVLFVRACRLLYHYRTQKSIDFEKMSHFWDNYFIALFLLFLHNRGIIPSPQYYIAENALLTGRF